MNTVMNLLVHKMLGSSRVAAQLAVSQEGLSSVSKLNISTEYSFSVGVLFVINGH
jgi:hypothetical protein